ncbi:MAG: hypothetical protein KTR32_16905 [Granulosicoccus sp.]|nr:hypothetical protein [Granulosicoccus sp.]
MPRNALKVFKTFAVQRNALIIAAIAGTLLNCINQLPDIINGHPINLLKLLLTYLVPYSVSLVSAIMLSNRNQQP